MTELSKDLREVLAKVGTSTLTGVLNRRGLKNMTLFDVWPMRPEQPAMVGIAFTMRFIPSRDDKDGPTSTSRSMVQPQAMEECPPGHVLMIDSRGDSRAASAGDLYIGRLKACGAAGIDRRRLSRHQRRLQDWPARLSSPPILAAVADR